MFIVATLQMNEAAATAVVWVIGSQTVQNWRQYRISRPQTLDGVTILLAMLLITKSCVSYCALSGNKYPGTGMMLTVVPAGKSWIGALCALRYFSKKMPTRKIRYVKQIFHMHVYLSYEN